MHMDTNIQFTKKCIKFKSEHFWPPKKTNDSNTFNDTTDADSLTRIASSPTKCPVCQCDFATAHVGIGESCLLEPANPTNNTAKNDTNQGNVVALKKCNDVADKMSDEPGFNGFNNGIGDTAFIIRLKTLVNLLN
jgi:hypothetical protein